MAAPVFVSHLRSFAVHVGIYQSKVSTRASRVERDEALGSILILLVAIARSPAPPSVFARGGPPGLIAVAARSDRCKTCPNSSWSSRECAACRFLCRDQLRPIMRCSERSARRHTSGGYSRNRTSFKNNAMSVAARKNLELPLHTLVHLSDARGPVLALRYFTSSRDTAC